MSEQQHASPTEGGTEWEASQAWELIIAGREERDGDKERLGWSRWGDAMRNRVVGALAEQLIPMLQELRGIRDDRSTDATIANHKLDLIITSVEASQAEWGRLEARLSLVETSTLAHVLPQTERERLVELARTIPDLTRRLVALENAQRSQR